MTRVVESIDIDVPVHVAFERWTQFESFPQFLDFVESVEQIDNAHTHWRVKIAGAVREFDAEITEQLPAERVAWNSIHGDADHTGVVTFDKLSDSRSRITVQLDWVAEDFLEIVGAAFGVDDHVVRKDLKKFKAFVENPDTRNGRVRGNVSM